MANWMRFIPLKWVVIGAAGFIVIMIKQYFRGGICRSKALMIGKTVIVTGSNSGIGKATALELAKRKARVILACRDIKSAEKAVKEIRQVTLHGDLIVKHLNLASLQSIRNFASEILQEQPKIDVLINNAGLYQCPYEETEDGFEMQIGVNHLGHFLLTNLLLDRLKYSAPSRIIVVTSSLHKKGNINCEELNQKRENYNKKNGYNNSKLANNLFSRELIKKLEGTGVGVFCVHPGMVRTNLARFIKIPKVIKLMLFPLAWLLLKSPWDGCQTVIYCAIAEELEGKSGGYYGNCKEEPWTEISMNDELASKLWQTSESLTKLA